MNVVEFDLMAISVYYKTKLEMRSVWALFKNTIYFTKKEHILNIEQRFE